MDIKHPLHSSLTCLWQMFLTFDGNRNVSRITLPLANVRSLTSSMCCCIIYAGDSSKNAFELFCAPYLPRCQLLTHTGIHWPLIHGGVHHVCWGAMYSRKPTCTMRDEDKDFFATKHCWHPLLIEPLITVLPMRLILRIIVFIIENES